MLLSLQFFKHLASPPPKLQPFHPVSGSWGLLQAMWQMCAPTAGIFSNAKVESIREEENSNSLNRHWWWQVQGEGCDLDNCLWKRTWLQYEARSCFIDSRKNSCLIDPRKNSESSDFRFGWSLKLDLSTFPWLFVVNELFVAWMGCESSN